MLLSAVLDRHARVSRVSSTSTLSIARSFPRTLAPSHPLSFSATLARPVPSGPVQSRPGRDHGRDHDRDRPLSVMRRAMTPEPSVTPIRLSTAEKSPGEALVTHCERASEQHGAKRRHISSHQARCTKKKVGEVVAELSNDSEVGQEKAESRGRERTRARETDEREREREEEEEQEERKKAKQHRGKHGRTFHSSALVFS